jgi:hypothetical protein
MAGEEPDPTLMLQMSITTPNYSQKNPGASKTDQAVGTAIGGCDWKAPELKLDR